MKSEVGILRWHPDGFDQEPETEMQPIKHKEHFLTSNNYNCTGEWKIATLLTNVVKYVIKNKPLIHYVKVPFNNADSFESLVRNQPIANLKTTV